MRAILINATERTISEVEFDGNIERLKEMAGIEWITLGAALFNGDTLYVDDEGLYKFQKFFRLTPRGQWLAGNGIIVGEETEERLTSARSKLDYLRGEIQFGEAEAPPLGPGPAPKYEF